MTGVPLILLIWLIVFLVRSASSYPRPATSPRRRLTYYGQLNTHIDLTVRPRPATGLPLYKQVQQSIALHPDGPIPHDEFPQIAADTPGVLYQPGARDLAEHDTATDDAWMTIMAAVYAARKNKLTNWQVLEHNVKSVPFGKHVNTVLKQLTFDELTFNVRTLFLTLARHSSDYEAVKWGILIGSIKEINSIEINDLLLLARHSEFTFVVCHILSRRARWYSHHYPNIVLLLPLTEGWGLYRVIDALAKEPELWKREGMHRDVVIFATKNGGGAKAQIASMLLSSDEFPDLLNGAQGDETLGYALLDLLDAILWADQLPGFMGTLQNGGSITGGYLDLIAGLPPAIEVLATLRGILILSGMDDLTWEEKSALHDRAETMLLERLARETITDAIQSGNHRETAMLLIREVGLNDLLYLVLEDFRREPTPLNIQLLGSMGNEEHLQEILRLLPEPEEVLKRGEITDESPFSVDLYKRSIIYAAVIRYAGKQRTPAAISRTNAAARDFHPWVRASAMISMQFLQAYTLNAESKALVRDCLNDPEEIVRNAAEMTARHHALHTSINRTGVGRIAMIEGVSVN